MKMKKTVSLILALALVASFSLSAYATPPASVSDHGAVGNLKTYATCNKQISSGGANTSVDLPNTGASLYVEATYIFILSSGATPQTQPQKQTKSSTGQSGTLGQLATVSFSPGSSYVSLNISSIHRVKLGSTWETELNC